MPTSTWKNIETFIEIVVKTRAESFLDLGVGNGKWGFLFREYTDVWAERYKKEQWTAVVDGIEIYGKYIQEHQKAVYSNIYVHDVLSVIDELGRYDIILAADVLEHIRKPEAVGLLNKLKSKINTALIVSVPLGQGWLRKTFNENEHEAHISVWETDDLRKLGFNYYNVRLAPDGKRKIGFFVYSVDKIKIDSLNKLKKGFFR